VAINLKRFEFDFNTM
jgi:ubiquitin carboxyl-terminal hydrolase 9/24